MDVPSLKPSDTNAEWAEVVAPRQLVPGTPAFMRQRIAELELALGQIAHFNSPDPEMGFMEERDTLIAIARNALGLQAR